MKTFNTILAVIAATLLFAGCVNEEPNYKKNNGTGGTENSGTGYLELSGMNLKVIFDDKTETHPDDTENETQRPDSRANTRTADVDAFIVEIFDSKNTSVLQKSYGELKADLAEQKLELPVGTYRMEVRSEQTIPDVAWEHPSYKGSQSISLLKGETTTIRDVVCTLANIKVTMLCSADLAARLNTDPAVTKATISLGETKETFAIGETRAVYFRAPETVNTLKYLLDGEFSDGAAVKFNSQINNVKAGQWRKISLVIVYADKGTVGIDIKVDNFVLDEEIHIDGSASWREELLPEEPVIDPSAPVITRPGHSLSDPIELEESMFDQDGNCTSSFAFALASPNALQHFAVSFGSTNGQLLDELKEKLGTDAAIDLCTLGQNSSAYAWFRLFGFPVGSSLSGAASKDFDLAGMMPTLYKTDGTHTINITLTDARGLTTTTILTVVVKKTTPPEIVWVGHDITQSELLVKDMVVRVDINAEAGLKSVKVNIESEALAPMLALFPGLVGTFDLCTIDTTHPDDAKFLQETVGFPVGGQVKDQTAIFFEISALFTGILKDLESKDGVVNHYKFHLDVLDNAGNSTKAVLHLIQPEVISK